MLSLSKDNYQTVEIVTSGNAESVSVITHNDIPNRRLILKEFLDFDSFSLEKYTKELFSYQHPKIFYTPRLYAYNNSRKVLVIDFVEHITISPESLNSHIPSILSMLRAFHNSDSDISFPLSLSKTYLPEERIRRVQKHDLARVCPTNETKSCVLDFLHSPTSDRLVPSHGDFHIRNVLFSTTKDYFFIDWGLARYASPNFDLGFFAYKTSMGQYMPRLSILEINELLNNLCRFYKDTSRKEIVIYFIYCMLMDFYWALEYKEKFSDDDYNTIITNIRDFFANFETNLKFICS
ncbi:aminoglycoside phosphotransferase family protein [candidate division WWE3 bacterium]|uniref:Aminoglycoside phosphotransferase family protein n=1 Tax=candidate division WWE3 bacterium TaxID=2053526 RepID=A0A955EBJ0_UNCKA|nr:aminoglycoside phosphotransferase family protein [candidate division WWE3 bacterium]